VPEQKTAAFHENENFRCAIDARAARNCASFAQQSPSARHGGDFFRGFVKSAACKPVHLIYIQCGFGRAENRFRREPGEESPNTKGRDAA
jgi:hypothetical protein